MPELQVARACEQAGLSLTKSRGEAPCFPQIIERGARSSSECIQAFGGLLLNFTDVGRIDAKLTGKNTLGGTWMSVKGRLPDQELNN